MTEHRSNTCWTQGVEIEEKYRCIHNNMLDLIHCASGRVCCLPVQDLRLPVVYVPAVKNRKNGQAVLRHRGLIHEFYKKQQFCDPENAVVRHRQRNNTGKIRLCVPAMHG